MFMQIRWTRFVSCLTSCSRLLYSPSVFSLMIMISMFLWRVWTPGRDWQCITLAKRSKLVLLMHTETKKNNRSLYISGNKHRRQAQSMICNVLLDLSPKDVISGFDRGRHGMIGFYVTCRGNSQVNITKVSWSRYKPHSTCSFLNHSFLLVTQTRRFFLPLRATPLRRMAMMALFMSSSFSSAELTCTTSKSTGTQLNLQHKHTKNMKS